MTDTYRKLYDLLDGRERRNALLLLGIMLVLGFVEALSIASILPFVAVLSKPQLIHDNPYLAAAYNVLGFTSSNSFLIFLGVGALLVILGRIGVAALTNYAMARYTHMRSFTLSIRLLQNYMSRPYGWFLNRHSAGMAKSVLSEAEEVVKGSLMRALDLVTQLIVATCLISLVIIVQPRVTLTAMLLVGMAYALIYFSLQRFMKRLGQERLIANRERFQIAQEMLSGIKEVKIHGLEHRYLRRFTDVARRFAHRKATGAVISTMPRFFLEALAMAGIMTVVLLLLMSAEGDISKVLPVLTLYAFAALRLLPIMARFYADLTSLRFGGAALDAIHADLTEMRGSAALQKSGSKLSLRESIELRGITFTYQKAESPAVFDIDLKIPARTTAGFVGSTGAGKTTLIDIIIGLLEPQQGQIRIDGLPITDENVRDWQRTIGYVPQQIFLTDDTVAANIAFGIPPDKIDMHMVERVSRIAELHTFVVEELPHAYETMIGERGVRLSGGQRQRIGIARALYHDPDLLVFDEATSALDNLTERSVMDAVHNLAHQKTILIIAHRLSTVCACDQLFLLEYGRLKASGRYEELVNADQVFRQMAS